MKKLILLFLLIPQFCFAAVNFPAAGSSMLSCGSTDDIFLENGALTMSAWIYPTVDILGSGFIPRIFGRDSPSSGGSGIYLALGATKSPFFVVGGSTPLNHSSVDNSITFNTWQHILVTWDGSSTAANSKIYINGVETSYDFTQDGIGINDTSAWTTVIGNLNDAVRPFAGNIHNFAVWNSVLSSANIALIYNGGKQGTDLSTIARSNLKMWVKMNECPDGVVCTGTFSDYTGVHNCTATTSPVGYGSPVTDINNGTVYNGTIY